MLYSTDTQLQIRNSSLIFFNPVRISKERRETLAARRILNLQSKVQSDGTIIQSQKTYSGKTTVHNRRRIRKAVNILLQLCEEKVIYNPVLDRNVNHKLSFITLTISKSDENISAKEAYKNLLKPFLQWLQKTEKVNTYIWKAELQKRGQIHYHITTPAFVSWQKIKDKWNYLQRKHGYLEAFKKRYGHDNPNSTDVHSVYKVNNIEAYLEKYLSKEEQNETSIDGKIWDCSINLKGVKYFSTDLKPHHEKQINALNVGDELNEFEADYFSVIKFKSKKPALVLYGYEHTIYNDWKNEIRYYRKNRSVRKLSVTSTNHLHSTSAKRSNMVEQLHLF